MDVNVRGYTREVRVVTIYNMTVPHLALNQKTQQMNVGVSLFKSESKPQTPAKEEDKSNQLVCYWRLSLGSSYVNYIQNAPRDVDWRLRNIRKT